MDCDVVVVGAGPAGAAAATTLARSGRDVVVVDRAPFPRDKCCGDGLTTAALRGLERLGLDPASVPSWTVVDDTVVHSPSGRTARFPLPRGQGQYAAVARRHELDAALVDVAREAGAKVLDGHACVDASERDDRVVVEVDGIGPVQARYAVGADGMWSPLRRHLGLSTPGYRGELHAFRQYFADVGPDARDLHVWFEPDVLPGYAWSFPLEGDRANVGFGIHRGAKISVPDMKRVWPDLLARPQVRRVLGPAAVPEAPHKAWPIPTRVDRVPLTSERTLFVGDAAAAVDPMTGEGIAQALDTGVLAADAVMAAGPHDASRATARYQAMVGRALFADLRVSRFFVRALRHRKGARAAVRFAGATPWTRRNFARWTVRGLPPGDAADAAPLAPPHVHRPWSVPSTPDTPVRRR